MFRKFAFCHMHQFHPEDVKLSHSQNIRIFFQVHAPEKDDLIYFVSADTNPLRGAFFSQQTV